MRAEDFPVKGGRSPDANYEVRLHSEPGSESPYAYILAIYRVGEAEPIGVIEDSTTYMTLAMAKERCQAFWHGSSRLVGVTNQGTRHTVELYLFAVDRGKAERLTFPDYVQNALGRVDATERGMYCISRPKGWEQDDLAIELFFKADQPDGSHGYKTEVILHCERGEHSFPVIRLKSLSQPEPSQG